MKNIDKIRDILIVAVVVVTTVNVIRSTSDSPEMHTKMDDGTSITIKKSGGNMKGRYEVVMCQLKVAEQRCDTKGLIPDE